MDSNIKLDIRLGLKLGIVFLAFLGDSKLYAATYNFYFNNTEQGDHSQAKPELNINGLPSGNQENKTGDAQAVKVEGTNLQTIPAPSNSTPDSGTVNPSGNYNNEEVITPNTPVAGPPQGGSVSSEMKTAQQMGPLDLVTGTGVSYQSGFKDSAPGGRGSSMGASWIKIPLFLGVALQESKHAFGLIGDVNFLSQAAKGAPTVLGPPSLGVLGKVRFNDFLNVTASTYATLGKAADKRFSKSEFGRTLYTGAVGLSYDSGAAARGILGDLQLQVDSKGDAERSFGRVKYKYEYGTALSTLTKLGIRANIFNIFAAATLHHLDSFKVSSKGFRLDRKDINLFTAGPRVEIAFKGVNLFTEAQFLVSSTKQAPLEILGNPKAFGVGNNRFITGLNIYL